MYQFLRDICGMKYIICDKTISQDIKTHYNWIVSNDYLQYIFNTYIDVVNNFWKELNTCPNQPKSKSSDDLIVKYTYPKQELYLTNIIKIDLQKAFLTYSEKIMNDDALELYSKTCSALASNSQLPASANKFLYNYFLTNIIVHCMGLDALYKLRYMVYDDVLYVAEHIGEIIKSEIDGAYIKPYNIKATDDVYNIYGQISITKYKWILFKQRYTIGLKDNNKITLKGFDSSTPNIYYNLITKLCLTDSAQDMDYIIDSFLFNNKDSVLDFAYKSPDGSSIKLKLQNMNATINSKDIDMNTINDLHDRIDHEHYIKDIYPVLSSIFSNISI